MRVKAILLPFIIFLFSAFSCKKETESLLTFHTPYGDMKAVLFDQTPKHKENFLKLVKDGYYDNTNFHRVINDFMVQAGNNSSQNPKYEYTIASEFNDSLIHRKGALAAARKSDQVNPDKRSDGTEFYIIQGKKNTRKELMTKLPYLHHYFNKMLVDYGHIYDSLHLEILRLQSELKYDSITAIALSKKEEIEYRYGINISKNYPKKRSDVYSNIGGTPHLDDEYTVFGQVLEGLDIIDSIAIQPTATYDKPIKEIYLKISVEEISVKKLIKKYPDLLKYVVIE